MEEYHSIETLYNTVLSAHPSSSTLSGVSLSSFVSSSMTSKYTAFINLDADNNIHSPAMFKFLNQYVVNLNNSYKANPMLFDIGLSPMNVGIKPVCYEVPKKQERK